MDVPAPPTVDTVSIAIVGTPVACADGVKETWAQVAAWVEVQLRNRFGEAVSIRYFDLFDTACPPLPENAQLPFVYINGEVFSNGGKISVPGLRAKLEALGVEPNRRPSASGL
jgi:hypothetical protein